MSNLKNIMEIINSREFLTCWSFSSNKTVLHTDCEFFLFNEILKSERDVGNYNLLKPQKNSIEMK